MKKIYIIFSTVVFITFLFFLYFHFNSYQFCRECIVNIKNYKNSVLYKEGMGFVYKVDDYAYILTNYHVISDGEKIVININDNEVVASILNYDEYYDIGILIVDKKYIDKSIKFGNMDNLEINDNLYIYCNLDNKRESLKLTSKTDSIKFSYQNESKMLDLFKFNGNVIDGYSGCPIFDKKNNAVGIITMVVDDDSNDGYAIPIYNISNKIFKLERGNLFHPNLGIVASSFSESLTGVKIDTVYEDYPAYIGNLKVGDIIVAINDVDIFDVVDFKYNLYKVNKGEKVKIKYYRDGKYFFTYLEL